MRRRGEDNGGCRDPCAERERETVDGIIEDAVVPELRRNVIVQTGSIDLRYRRYPRSWGKRNSTTGCLLLPILLLLLSPPPLSLPSSLLNIIFILLEYYQKSDLAEQQLDPADPAKFM
jgi:hypothetical protein